MKIIRLKQVMDVTGLARSTIYKHIADGVFPGAIPLGGRSVGWLESEIQDWIAARIGERSR